MPQYSCAALAFYSVRTPYSITYIYMCYNRACYINMQYIMFVWSWHRACRPSVHPNDEQILMHIATITCTHLLTQLNDIFISNILRIWTKHIFHRATYILQEEAKHASVYQTLVYAHTHKHYHSFQNNSRSKRTMRENPIETPILQCCRDIRFSRRFV